ncbi:MAG: PQQ-binding-like beta-propeller repeat protein [Eubacteriaceae bacterium]|jgi:hypothetical protein
MKKKLLSIALVLLVMIACFGFSAYAADKPTAQLSTGKTTYAAGESVPVKIILKGTKFTGGNFIVQFNTDKLELTSTKLTKGISADYYNDDTESGIFDTEGTYANLDNTKGIAKWSFTFSLSAYSNVTHSVTTSSTDLQYDMTDFYPYIDASTNDYTLCTINFKAKSDITLTNEDLKFVKDNQDCIFGLMLGDNDVITSVESTLDSATTETYSKLSSLLVTTGSTATADNTLLQSDGDNLGDAQVFNTDTMTYTLPDQLDNSLQLRFKAVPAESGATVTLGYGDNKTKDITYDGGSLKWDNCLSIGANTLTLTVTPPEGSANKASVYTLKVNVLPTLQSLSITADGNKTGIDPAFNKATNTYTASVSDSAKSLTINASPNKSDYTVTYDGSESNTVDISSKTSVTVAVKTSDGTENDYTINLNKVAAETFKITTDPADAIVKVYSPEGYEVAASEKGTYQGLFNNGDYTYTVTKTGYKAVTGTIPKDGGQKSVTLEAAAANPDDVGSYWPSFRGNNQNMGITSVSLPVDPDNTSLKWNKKLGTGWGAAPSVQIIANNSLIVMSGTSLYSLDLESGEIKAKGTMSASPNFGYTPPTYADGMIFCPLSNGTIQAFDAASLESLWIYNDPLKGQSLSQITYSDGYIYTGFWNSETKDANYVCLSVSDEDTTKKDEAKTATWRYTQAGGFYWAGSVAVGNSLIVGTDDGASGWSGNSNLLVFDKTTGTLTQQLELTGAGDQRSSISYDTSTGKIYFTTKNGYLYKASVNADTGAVSNLTGKKTLNQSTSTPVVYKGRIYVGTGGGVGSKGSIAVCDEGTLDQIYNVELTGYPQCSILLSTANEAATGKIDIYTTYNTTPGGIDLIEVAPDATSADQASLVKLYNADGFSQYCICSPICGENGTLYYKNDSGNILAVSVSAQVNVIDLIKQIGTVTENSGDAITKAETAYNALTDEEKAKVTNYSTLTDARTAYDAILADKAAAQAVTDQINALPALDKLTLANEEAVQSARTALNGLSENAAKYVPDTAVTKLENSESRITELKQEKSDQEAADAVIAEIDSLPAEITESDISAVTGAKADFDSLTQAQQALVTNKSKLDGAVTAANQIKADKAAAAAISQRIQNLDVDNLTLSDSPTVAKISGDYEKLTDAQKQYVSQADLSKLNKAKETIQNLQQQADDQQQADAVTAVINKLPDTVTLSDKSAVEAARTGYDALTDDQKKLVTAETLQKLENAEKAIQQIVADNQAAADAVTAKINAIGEVTLNSENSINDAEQSYNSLTDDQKALITADTLKTLTDAKDKLAQLKVDTEVSDYQKLVDAANAAIKANDGNIGTSMDAMKAAYDKLSDTARAKVSKITAAATQAAVDKAAENHQVKLSDGTIYTVTKADGSSLPYDAKVTAGAQVSAATLASVQKNYPDDQILMPFNLEVTGYEGQLKVSFPYDTDAYDVSTLKIVHINEDGISDALSVSYSNGTISFITDSTSDFVLIGQKKAATPEKGQDQTTGTDSATAGTSTGSASGTSSNAGTGIEDAYPAYILMLALCAAAAGTMVALKGKKEQEEQ